jgi:hypothetical protein
MDRLKSQYTCTNLHRIAPRTTVDLRFVNTLIFTVIFVFGMMYDVKEHGQWCVRWYCDGVDWR